MDFFESSNAQLEACSYCGRNFAVENLKRHENVCQKTSRKRPVFDSSKQRNVVAVSKNHQIKNKSLSYTKPGSRTKASKQSSWRQKHEEFIRTVKAAREATVAIKEGRKPPPPPPAAINPDYVQCPHCLRRFNETAAERHIRFCAEQSKRLSNKKNTISNISNQAALRASARQYCPPLPNSTKQKVEATSTMTRSGRVNARSSHLKENFEKPDRFTKQKFKHKPHDWDSSVDLIPSAVEVRSKTGLRPSSGYNSTKSNKQFSMQTQQKSSKPPIRKVAGKRNNFHSNSVKQQEMFHHDYSLENSDNESDQFQNYSARAYEPSSANNYQSVKISKSSNVSGTDFKRTTSKKKSSVNEFGAKPNSYSYTDNAESDFYNWLNKGKTASSMLDQKQNALPSKFCHECGSRYPISNAKFCCECGVKRIML